VAGMVSRYDVAMLLRQHWPLLNWKGDDHTAGVYFDEAYGYMVEKSYAVRMKHDEPTSPAFYVPSWDEQEDEVLVTFPYKNMKKRPNKYQPLFTQNELTQKDLSSLFDGKSEHQMEIPIQPLIELLELIPKKRERDLTWLYLKAEKSYIKASIFHRIQDGFEPRIESFIPCENGSLCITINSNAFLHTLKLFSWASTVLITNLHDRIRVTNRQHSTEIEVILALPKKAILREIENYSSL
jgi:hypothetical protein